jgi:hypothetical protein
MNQTTLTRVWSAAALILLYFSLNAWSLTQGWQLSLPGFPFHEGGFTRYGVTLVAIPLAGSLLAVTALLVRLYAQRTHSSDWAGRFPRFSGVALDVSRPEGRLFQAASLCSLLLLPMAAQIHFTLKFLAGSVYRGNARLWSAFEDLAHYLPVREALSGAFTYDRLGEVAPTFFPFWEPWLFVLLEVAIVSAVVSCLVAVFRPTRHSDRLRG